MTTKYPFIIKDKVKLSRDDTKNGRFYYLDEQPEKRFPSITTFLSWIEPEEKKAGLEKWRKKIGDNEADKILQTSVDLGNEIHEQFEKYFSGESIKGYSYKSQLMFRSGLNYLKSQITDIYGCELSCYSEKIGLAGTADFVVKLNGIPTVIDFKNSRKQKRKEWIKNYFLQATAYGKMLHDTYQIPIRRGLILIMGWDGNLTPFPFTMKQYYSELKRLVEEKNQYANFN